MWFYSGSIILFLLDGWHEFYFIFFPYIREMKILGNQLFLFEKTQPKVDGNPLKLGRGEGKAHKCKKI